MLVTKRFAFAGPVAGPPLGTLSKLPNEITSVIVNDLDVETYLNFRKVNRRAREIVANTLEFHRIVRHAPTCLLAMIRTGVARSHTFASLYHAMLLRDCEVCHNLAAYVYLPTLTKACDKCLSLESRFLTVTLASFAKGACWSTARLRRHVPVVKTIPGNYRNWDDVRTRSVDMVCYEEARKIIMDDTRPIKPGYGDQSGGMFIRRMVTAPLPFFNKETQQVEPLLTCKGCAIKWEEAFTGVHTQDSYQSRLWRYTGDHSKEGLLEHFGHCASARRLWALSNGGTISTKAWETTFIRKGGVKKELRMR
ncbi:hypothetical protein BR93DRAFT_985876 [Coniochaeta sp. PMI_546]|nr:hypothetical protein BR93DRAFT_985876 [Coniochaeta sp. PMI_546]